MARSDGFDRDEDEEAEGAAGSDGGEPRVRRAPVIVTGIVASARREGRFVVLADGHDFATVSLEILERLQLRVGQRLTESVTAQLLEESATLSTYDRALNMLAAQPRSARDLRRRLVLKGEEPQRADVAIERLRARGFIDDEQFARAFTRSRVASQGASKRRLQQELFKRGVTREVADEAIADVWATENVDDDAAVEQTARKKLRSLGGLDAPTRRRRLYAFLARRGYEADAIRRTMTRVLISLDTEPDDELSVD